MVARFPIYIYPSASGTETCSSASLANYILLVVEIIVTLCCGELRWLSELPTPCTLQRLTQLALGSARPELCDCCPRSACFAKLQLFATVADSGAIPFPIVQCFVTEIAGRPDIVALSAPHAIFFCASGPAGFIRLMHSVGSLRSNALTGKAPGPRTMADNLLQDFPRRASSERLRW